METYTDLVKGEPKGESMADLNSYLGDDMVSTPVTNPEVHAERETALVLQMSQTIVANDESYALAA
jgi:hypothetical protein